MGAKKNFVLDTNVVLHDYNCLSNFQENDVYLPITILEELDRFKKGSEQINYNARQFVRILDELTQNDFSLRGASLGEGKGMLYVVTQDLYDVKLAEVFPDRIPDNRILSCTLYVAEQHKDNKTILVTKDINMRMKARSLGIPVEDYNTDKVQDINIFEHSQPTYSGIDSDLIDRLYATSNGVPLDEFTAKYPDIKLAANECFILESERNSVLVRSNAFSETIKKIDKGTPNYGISARNTEQKFAFNVLNDPDIKLIGITGKAGTGKTLLALAAALKQMKQYKQILLARPIISLANKDIGFLPGTEKEKIMPYMQPLFDNLNVIKAQFSQNSLEVRQIDEMLKNNLLVIEALAYIRGRSLTETFCIVDEAQNLTPHEIKTIITRTGEGTKMVFTGDVEQIDSPYLDMQSNGLAYMVDKMKGQKLFAHINLVKGERSELAELAANLL
ncbi:MAG: PhoH family protein [Tannerella sp.]|jgi:PhoH-like ATPase|nr:PhoH family protein [Tannerella sp.]